MDLKTVFALLFVIVVAVVIAMSTAAVEKPDLDPGEAPGWAESLGDLLVTTRALDPDDLVSPTPPTCPDLFDDVPFVLEAGQACTYQAEAAGGIRGSIRLLTLRASGGGTAEVRVRPTDDRLLREHHLLGPSPTEIEIGQAGAALRFSCSGGGSCTLTRLS